MRILLITDQAPDSNHSAIQGIFNGYLKQYAEVDLVYFDKAATRPNASEGKLILPYKYKRRNTLAGLRLLVDPASYQFIIVRNFFKVLRDVLSNRKRYGYRVGFWESFPHSFRRIHEARETGRAVLRKSLEYAIKRRLEKRLIEQCDFYLPITETFKSRFYPELKIPYMALPMGVDFAKIEMFTRPERHDDAKRFIYIGAVDRLRKLDLIVSAFSRVQGNFSLDLYTASQNEFVEELRKLASVDSRIHIHPAQPRTQLFRTMSDYDVGIGLIPETPLYEVSSPTKTLEYYAVGVPAIINPLPEYNSLFDDRSAFICDMTLEGISSTVSRILALSRSALSQAGLNGRSIVISERAYSVLAAKLHDFLQHL